jgi:hypothetical protein
VLACGHCWGGAPEIMRYGVSRTIRRLQSETPGRCQRGASPGAAGVTAAWRSANARVRSCVNCVSANKVAAAGPRRPYKPQRRRGSSTPATQPPLLLLWQCCLGPHVPLQPSPPGDTQAPQPTRPGTPGPSGSKVRDVTTATPRFLSAAQARRCTFSARHSRHEAP